MDDEMRLARVDALTNLRNEGMRMANEGADSLEVRDFIDRGKKEIAFELPDGESHRKAVKAASRHAKKKG